MYVYIVKRLLLIFPVLVLISVVVFSITRLIPGDVVIMLLEETGRVSKENIGLLTQELGLNKPIYTQYFVWLWNALHGNFGTSYYNQQPVLGELIKRIPVTLQLGIMSMIVSILIALPVGIIAATKRNTVLDYVVRVISVIGLAVPSFWLATLLLVIPAVQFGYVPPVGFTPLTEDPIKNLQQLMFPVIALGSMLAAYTMRMTRSALLEVMNMDYIRTARAKGVKERIVIYRHALRNALIPVLSVIGVQLGPILGGTVIIESIFGIPGIGRLTLFAIQWRDFPQLQVNVLFFAIIFVLINLIIDVLYAYVDPRIRYD